MWSSWERAARDALLDAVLPGGVVDGQPGLAELDLREFWRRFAREAPPQLRLGLRVSVWFFALAPPLLLGRPRTALGLSPAQRAELLQRAASSRWAPLRQLPLALKLTACWAYFSHGATRRPFSPNDNAFAPAPLALDSAEAAPR